LVEAEARKRFAGGRVIGSHFDKVGARLEATRQAIAAGDPVLFEASFAIGDILIRADALERLPDGGWALVEIKSSSSLKDEHLPDAAVQTSVLRRCGVDVRRVEIMHLNKAFLHPDVGELFERVDVTARVEAYVADVPHIVESHVAALKG